MQIVQRHTQTLTRGTSAQNSVQRDDSSDVEVRVRLQDERTGQRVGAGCHVTEQTYGQLLSLRTPRRCAVRRWVGGEREEGWTNYRETNNIDAAVMVLVACEATTRS